jgi:serine/threonine protein kinase
MGAEGPEVSPLAALPSRFGKYTILGHLATGGMAEVYLARAEGIEGFEKIVVIKRIRPELTGDRSTTRMFLHEARLAASLEHPNIAHVHEIDIVQGHYFFVMEYVHGADLRQVMEAAHRKGKRISLDDAIEIIIDVCAALHYAHEKRDADDNPLGIIHRDVSPSNVLISHDGAVKVCDFGIAKVTTRSSDTQRGVVKGKFSYMAPEQCLSEPVDRRSDIFVIGILLYEVTTLTRLFQANADFELMRQIVQDPVRPPSSRVADYPPELERIVMRALARDPDDRYPTAQMMQLELEAFARERKLATSSVGLARLMGDLFEKRVRAWRKADRDGIPLGDHLLDHTHLSEADETYVPVQTTESQDDIQTHRGAPETSPPVAVGAREESRRRRPARRRSVGWLIGALVAALVGAGAVMGESWMARSRERAAPDGLTGEADKIAAVIDSTIRAARLQADAIASTPMLRAAIATDAATVKDMETSEALFSPSPGQVLEIFQLRVGLVPLLRIPPAADQVKPVAERGARLELRGDRLVVAVGAPITEHGSAQVGGALALAVPVDLAPISRRLGGQAEAACLTGLGPPISLVGPAGGPRPVSVRLPASPDWQITPLALSAAPRIPPGPGWVFAVQLAAAAIALLMFSLYVFSRRRR